MGVIDTFSTIVTSKYETFLSSLPNWAQQVTNLFLLIILVVIYAWFIWKFYRFVAKKNVIALNLSQYNTSNHPVFEKIIAGIFYFLEYIIIFPFMIFFWFIVFTLFLILLNEGLELKNIVVMSATIVGAIRIISYFPKYGQELAKEIAKLLPFTLLAISMIKPGFFDVERVISQITLIPNFFSIILIYLVFIVSLEILLRIIEFFLSLFGLKEEQKKED